MKYITIPINLVSIVEEGLHSNVRTVFTASEMDSLRESIRTKGLINTLIVRQVGKQYQLLGGERRLRSLKKLIADKTECWSPVDKKWVSAVELYQNLEVKCFECDDETAIHLAVIDNVERQDLTEIEKIEACIKFDNTLDDNGEHRFPRVKIGEMFRSSESWVSQTISMGKLPKPVLDALRNGCLTRTAALQFLKVEPSKVVGVLNYVIKRTHDDVQQEIERASVEVAEDIKKVQVAQADLEMAEVRAKRAPINKKTDAARLIRSSESELEEATDRLAKSKERLRLLNGTSSPKNAAITADAVAKATEEVGARTGRGRPLSIKQIRKSREELDEILESAKNKKKKNAALLASRFFKFILKEDTLNSVSELIDEISEIA